MKENKEMFDQPHRDHQRPFWAHHGRSFQQIGRGNVAPNILKALKEKPMHGYEIMQYFAQISFGAWQPSPGSVYPLLQSLQDQGLVTSKEEDGKRIFSLTQEGQKKVETAGATFSWHDRMNDKYDKKELGEIIKQIFRSDFGRFAQVAKIITRHGSKEDLQQMSEIINKVTDKLSVLASKINNKT